jgi:hypothetical protein
MVDLDKTSPSFAFASSRLDRIVTKLARAKGVTVVAAVSLEAPMVDSGSITYRIDLIGGALPATMHLDHQAFTAAGDSFTTLVVPKLEAALEKLRPH